MYITIIYIYILSRRIVGRGPTIQLLAAGPTIMLETSAKQSFEY